MEHAQIQYCLEDLSTLQSEPCKTKIALILDGHDMATRLGPPVRPIRGNKQYSVSTRVQQSYPRQEGRQAIRLRLQG